MKFSTSLCAAMLCVCSLVQAAGVGTTGAQFLKINPSARAAAMGGAFAAIADDAFATYANPAGLAQLETSVFGASYVSYFADVKYGYITYASPLRSMGVFGFSYTYLLVDGIDKRDINEAKLGSFNAKDTSVALTYGKKNALPQILEGMDVGFNLRMINSEIDQTIAYTGAMDVAAGYRPVEALNTVLSVQNMGAGIKFKEDTDPLPLNVKLGLGYRHNNRLALTGEIDEYLVDNKFYGALGGEYWVVPQLAVRVGYRAGYDTASLGSLVGVSGGLGFRIWSVGMDYAFVPFGDLGDTHRISFVVRF